MTEQTRRPSLDDFDAYADRDGQDPGSDATDATEAETPPENLRKLRGEAGPDASAMEAIDRATASVGHDDGVR